MSIEAVEAEIRRSAARGYHFSNGDFSADLVGVAFPLPVRHRRLSVVVAGPQFRCLDRTAEIAETIRLAIARFAGDLSADEGAIA